MPRTRTRTTVTASLAALTAALAVVPGAGAQAPGAAAPADPKLEVTGAYLYVDHDHGRPGDAYVKVVFRTADPFARRSDGAIRGGAKIAGVGGSIGSVKRGAPVYTTALPIRDGKISAIDADGELTKVAAKVGRSFRVTVTGRDGQEVTRTLKLRAEKPGDDAGRPLRA